MCMRTGSAREMALAIPRTLTYACQVQPWHCVVGNDVIALKLLQEDSLKVCFMDQMTVSVFGKTDIYNCFFWGTYCLCRRQSGAESAKAMVTFVEKCRFVSRWNCFGLEHSLFGVTRSKNVFFSYWLGLLLWFYLWGFHSRTVQTDGIRMNEETELCIITSCLRKGCIGASCCGYNYIIIK
jgi:hypothetical protein